MSLKFVDKLVFMTMTSFCAKAWVYVYRVGGLVSTAGSIGARFASPFVRLSGVPLSCVEPHANFAINLRSALLES